MFAPFPTVYNRVLFHGAEELVASSPSLPDLLTGQVPQTLPSPSVVF